MNSAPSFPLLQLPVAFPICRGQRRSARRHYTQVIQHLFGSLNSGEWVGEGGASSDTELSSQPHQRLARHKGLLDRDNNNSHTMTWRCEPSWRCQHHLLDTLCCRLHCWRATLHKAGRHFFPFCAISSLTNPLTYYSTWQPLSSSPASW